MWKKSLEIRRELLPSYTIKTTSEPLPTTRLMTLCTLNDTWAGILLGERETVTLLSVVISPWIFGTDNLRKSPEYGLVQFELRPLVPRSI